MLRFFPSRLILLLLLALVAFESWRAYSTYQAIMRGRSELIAAAELVQARNVDLTEAESAVATTGFEHAEEHFRRGHAVLQHDPLMFVAVRIPLVREQARALISLVSIGRSASAIGLDAMVVVEAARDTRGDGRSQGGADLLPLIEFVQPELDRIDARLEDIDGERAQIGNSKLLPPLASAVETVDRDLATVRESLDRLTDLQSLAPYLLGYDGPRTYLLLAQDNTEMTGGGGLITVYALLTLDEGHVQSLTFSDTSKVPVAVSFVEPPPPLRRYLLHGESWNLATSGWSPDFPTAARAAESFLNTGSAIDGVIAFNFHALEALLARLGPLPMVDYGLTLTSANATETILAQTHTPEALNGSKFAFVEDVARLLINSLFQSGAAARVLDTFDRLAREKQVLVHMKDPAAQARIVRLSIDGEVAATDSDYLMLADTSVLSTKLNLIVNESLDLRLSFDANGSVHHRAIVDYDNPLPDWASERDPYFVSQVMLGGVYGGYVRLLVPLDASLSNVTIDGVGGGLEDAGTEANHGWYGAFLPLLPGQGRSLTFEYATPFVARLDSGEFEYRLVLQKQSGASAHPVNISIELPPGARPTELSLDGNGRALARTSLRVSTDLTRDRELRLRYVLP